jgi:hypothetical protein
MATVSPARSKEGLVADNQTFAGQQRSKAMIGRAATAGLAGLGLIGGAGAVAYNDDGSATVKIKDKRGGEQTVPLYGDSGGKTYSCPTDAEDRLAPHDIKAGRIKLTLRQVRRVERKIEAQHPSHAAPGPVVDRYNALLRRDKRLVSAYNSTVDRRNAILKRDCV